MRYGHLNEEDSLNDCDSLFRNGKVMAIGFNCSAPGHITGALKEARAAWSEIPFVVYPNTGETWEGGSWSGDTDSAWLELIPQWVS